MRWLRKNNILFDARACDICGALHLDINISFCINQAKATRNGDRDDTKREQLYFFCMFERNAPNDKSASGMKCRQREKTRREKHGGKNNEVTRIKIIVPIIQIFTHKFKSKSRRRKINHWPRIKYIIKIKYNLEGFFLIVWKSNERKRKIRDQDTFPLLRDATPHASFCGWEARVCAHHDLDYVR